MKDLQLFPWHTIHTGMTLLQPKAIWPCPQEHGFLEGQTHRNILLHEEELRRRSTGPDWGGDFIWGMVSLHSYYSTSKCEAWGKKWLKTIKMLTIPSLVPSCLLSPPCLHSRAFVWIPKAGTEPRTFRDQHCITHSGNTGEHIGLCICKTCMSGVKNRINCKSEQLQ